jgi:PAS domain S-box-containing protein
MTSGKKTLLLALILLTVVNTIFLGLLQRRQFQENHVWLNLAFYFVVIILTVCITVIIIHEINSGKNNVEKVAVVITNDAMEKTLQQGGQNMELLLNNVKDYAIFMVDLDGRVASWNNGAENIKGYKAEEIIGQSTEIFYTSEDIIKNIPWQNLQMAKERGSYRDEGLRVRKDGSLFWADVTFSALRDEQGQLKGYAKVTRDVTDKKKLIDEVKFLANLVDQSTDAIVSIDMDGHIYTWNHGAEVLHGYEKKEVFGKSPSTIGIIDLADKEIENIIGEILHTGVWHAEMNFYHKNGLAFFGAVNANIIRDRLQEVVAIVFIVKDISRRKQLEDELHNYNIELESKIKERTKELYFNERRFRTLIENSFEAILLLDNSFRTIYRSPSATRITGWTDEDELTREPGKFIHPDDIPMVGEIFSEAVKNPGKSISVLFRCLHKKGHFIWLEGNLTNMLGNEYVKAVVFNARDATERILSDENIRESNKEISDYKFALDASGIVAITDQNGIIRHVNDNFCRISKYNASELIGHDHRMISSGFHSKHFIANLWKTIQSGNIWKGELKNKAKDGATYWVDTTIVPFLDENQKPYQYIAIRADITKRKEAEEVLAASETRFRALIENSAEGIALTDEFSNVFYRSPSSAKITGITPAANSISRAHPEDLLSIQTQIKESLCNPGVPINFQGRFQHSQGHYYWMEGSLTNMLGVKGLNAIVANYRDITKRKETEESLINSEKLYRGLFENMRHGFAYCKCIFEDGKLLDITYLVVNDEYELQTGLKNLTGRNISEIMPGLLESDIEYALRISRVVLTGKPESFETYVELLDVWFAVSLYSPDKGYFGALMDDITERKKAEYKVNRLNVELEKRVMRRTEQLREKNNELEAFSYSVSHDLRAPLRSIIGFTTILEEEYSSKLDEEARRLTGVIKNNTQKMGNLIDDLLTFSRMGRHEINKTKIDTNKMVEQVILELEQKSGRNQIRWIIHPMESLYADINTMRQVWVNLLSNAIKYSAGQSSPKIEISSGQNQDQVVFQVKDNGVGFDPKYTDKLFKVFQRLHGTNEFEGTGVGLAIVEKIISRHGGKVWAEGEVDKGASFYFSLPVK